MTTKKDIYECVRGHRTTFKSNGDKVYVNIRCPHKGCPETAHYQPQQEKTKAPRFLIADNPMAGAELYIVVTGKPVTIIQCSDFSVVVGKASPALLRRAADWYKAYLLFVNR